MSNFRQTILETLSRCGPLRVQAIARKAHVTPMAMRYHLTLLERTGLIVSHEVEPGGKVGRPQLEYALADAACERLPKKYDDLAGQLLEAVTDAFGPKAARTLLRRAGRRAAAAAALPPPGRAGMETRLKRTTKFLTERGYMARWAKSSDQITLSVCNCPFRQVALKHREVCELDTAMIGALLDVPPKMTRCIAHRDDQCQFLIPKRAENLT